MGRLIPLPVAKAYPPKGFISTIVLDSTIVFPLFIGRLSIQWSIEHNAVKDKVMILLHVQKRRKKKILLEAEVTEGMEIRIKKITRNRKALEWMIGTSEEREILEFIKENCNKQEEGGEEEIEKSL
jgi:hypothetical protein